MAVPAEYKDQKPAILIKAALDLIHEPGEVFEIRIPKTKAGTFAGYFKDTAIAASLIAKENGRHNAIYTTVNPVRPELIARYENRFEIGQPATTTDAEIDRRRWFLLDFDPKRPAGISSTDHELELAHIKAEEVKSWLSSIGWPEPIMAMSGNGWHLMYRVNEKNDDEARINFEFATKMLATIFTDNTVEVDTTIFNAARVWKVYGTLSRKGSDTAERPHRVAMLKKIPKELELLTMAQIENVARPLRDAKADEFKDMAGEFIGDIVKWLTDRGQTVVSGPRPMFGNEGQKWIISRCPFNSTHQSPVVGLVNNRPVFRCLHNTCSAYRWKEFREKIDPHYKDPDTVYLRLKEWCDGDSVECDGELLQTACATGKKLDPILKRLRKECPRPRVTLLEDFVRTERRRFQREVQGNQNTEKGNVVGLINRTRAMQSEGSCPMYWTADFDSRIRVGPVADIECPRYSEAHEIELMLKFHNVGDSWVKQTHASQVIKALAEEYRCNPMRTLMKSFRWDGTPRLDTWLPHYLATKDTPYTRAIGRKWLISAVARAMEPGCQADHMLILEGAQGIGKSSALRILGGQFYVEFSGIMRGGGTGHKDMVAVIIGKSIVEMSELATIKRADMESLKAILTTTCDDVRLSYERDAKSYPRTSVFAGTTNEVGQAYIFDMTGARRFWPTVAGETGPLKLELLKMDRDQLWAEAVDAYEEGEDWWSVPKEEVTAEQADRQMTVEMSEPWFPRIAAAITAPESYSNGLFHLVDEFEKGQPTGNFVVRAGDVADFLGTLIQVPIERQSAQDVLRVQKILRTLGFIKVRPSRGWRGNTYAYDLKQSVAPHLWPAVKAAREAAKFVKEVKEESKDDSRKN